jgi:hypothetical protein
MPQRSALDKNEVIHENSIELNTATAAALKTLVIDSLKGQSSLIIIILIIVIVNVNVIIVNHPHHPHHPYHHYPYPASGTVRAMASSEQDLHRSCC